MRIKGHTLDISMALHVHAEIKNVTSALERYCEGVTASWLVCVTLDQAIQV